MRKPYISKRVGGFCAAESYGILEAVKRNEQERRRGGSPVLCIAALMATML